MVGTFTLALHGVKINVCAHGALNVDVDIDVDLDLALVLDLD